MDAERFAGVQYLIHLAEVEDEAAVGDRAARQAGARALKGDGQAGAARFGENGAHVGFRAGKGDLRGAAGVPGFVAQIIHLFRLEGGHHERGNITCLWRNRTDKIPKL